MRIGIDYCGYNPKYPGGLHNFSLGLTKGLLNSVGHADSIVIIASSNNESAVKALLANLPVTFITVSIGKWTRYINWALWVFAWAIRKFKLRFWWDRYFRSRTMKFIDESVDVVIIPTAVLNFHALKTPSILCVHDIQQEYHPEFFPLAKRIIRWGSYRASCWRAAAIQASSKYISDCLIEKFAFIEPAKVFIAHEGVDFGEFSLTPQGERPEGLGDLGVDGFVFYPAQLWPHKNHLLLIDALAMFRDKTGFELPCVLTGYDYGHWRMVQDRIGEHELKCVYYLGRVSHSQMLWLYGNCRAVLALGLHESSSLPVREGAVFGKPLICVSIAPNIETQEFLRLRLVDKDNPIDLAGAFTELVEDGENRFADSAENAHLVKVFDWTCVARIYISVAKSLGSVVPPSNGSVDTGKAAV